MNDEIQRMLKSSLMTCHGNAVLNYQHDAIGEFPQYSDGFRQAGLTLLRALHESRVYADYEVCPIIFLFRHAFELALKGVIVAGSRLLKHHGCAPVLKDLHLRSHGFESFLPSIAAIFNHMGWSWNIGVGNIKQWRDFVRLAKYMGELDPGSYTFRYPVGTDGKPLVDHHTVVNPFVVAAQVDDVIHFLNGTAYALEDALYQDLEAEADMESFV